MVGRFYFGPARASCILRRKSLRGAAAPSGQRPITYAIARPPMGRVSILYLAAPHFSRKRMTKKKQADCRCNDAHSIVSRIEAA